MDRSFLIIVALVFFVGVVGFLTVTDHSGGVTGNVVREQSACESCVGTIVCAAKGGKVDNYPNACIAACEHARVVFDGECAYIPRAN